MESTKTNSSTLMRRILSIGLFLAIMMIFFVLSAQTTGAALTAGFNQHPGETYQIRLSDGGQSFNNVSPGAGNAYEGDFFRVGTAWARDGSGMGNSLQTCEEDQIINLWIYAHNGANFSDNHSAPLSEMTIAQLESQTVDSDFDFASNGVLENATVKINHAGQQSLDTTSFAHSHTLNLTLSADRRSGSTVSKSKSITISCANKEIALVTQSLETPSAVNWGGETQYANYGIRHLRAMQVFGSAYTLTDPGDIYTAAGSEFGFDGNVPASRYYAAYIKAQLKVKLMDPPPPVETTCEERGDCPPPVETTCEERGDCPPPVETTCEERGDCPPEPCVGCKPDIISETGSESSFSAQFLLLPGLAAILAFLIHRSISYRDRRFNN